MTRPAVAILRTAVRHDAGALATAAQRLADAL